MKILNNLTLIVLLSFPFQSAYSHGITFDVFSTQLLLPEYCSISAVGAMGRKGLDFHCVNDEPYWSFSGHFEHVEKSIYRNLNNHKIGVYRRETFSKQEHTFYDYDSNLDGNIDRYVYVVCETKLCLVLFYSMDSYLHISDVISQIGINNLHRDFLDGN